MGHRQHGLARLVPNPAPGRDDRSSCGSSIVANGIVALMLYRFRTGGANMRSVWICTRNDVIGNLERLSKRGRPADVGGQANERFSATASA